MSNIKKLMMSGAAGGGGLDVDEVFSTYVYTGNSSTQTINNGIDLTGEGGLTWFKCRNIGMLHNLFDTERGNTQRLDSSGTSEQSAQAAGRYPTFTSTGFTLGNDTGGDINYTGRNYVSWTFRKAPKFFDVVTYTGNGTSGRTVSHNLGCDVGCMIIKDINNANSWITYHRGVGATKYLELNSDSGASTASWMFNNTDPTSSVFTLGNNVAVNYSGREYIAYLFAHNDGDGEFGPDGDADIIKCGSYAGNGIANGPEIDLGFEPQWVLIKKTNLPSDWVLMDSMRGITAGGEADYFLRPNLTSIEVFDELITLEPTGFKVASNSSRVNSSSASPNYTYIAIRRGSLIPPESATDVFAVATRDSTKPAYDSGFPVDMAIRVNGKTGAHNTNISARLTQKRLINADSNYYEQDGNEYMFDYMDGWNNNASNDTNSIAWMWKRAPGYFDVVTWKGNVNQVSHNLGVQPEMIWVKHRNEIYDWMGAVNLNGDLLNLSINKNDGFYDDGSSTWDNNVTSTYFDKGTVVRRYSGATLAGATNEYIAYLFASLPGVSKIGSYTGNGSSQTINCGFTAGARFVLIKKATGPGYTVGYWTMFDTLRGIVSGNDALLRLSDTSAEITGWDSVDPHNSGFSVQTSSADLNQTGNTYIFYAIA